MKLVELRNTADHYTVSAPAGNGQTGEGRRTAHSSPELQTIRRVCELRLLAEGCKGLFAKWGKKGDRKERKGRGKEKLK